MNTEYINLDIDTIVIKSQRRKDLGDLSTLEGSIQIGRASCRERV